MKYFISFQAIREGGEYPTYGNCEIETKPIKNLKTLRSLEKKIQKDFNLEALAIMFWRRYE